MKDQNDRAPAILLTIICTALLVIFIPIIEATIAIIGFALYSYMPLILFSLREHYLGKMESRPGEHAPPEEIRKNNNNNRENQRKANFLKMLIWILIFIHIAWAIVGGIYHYNIIAEPMM